MQGTVSASDHALVVSLGELIISFVMQDPMADSADSLKLLEDWRLEAATWVQPPEPEPPTKGK